MHLINYLQAIYASLLAGHVFCTSNGMLNWFENQLPCVMHLALQETHRRSVVRSLLTTRSAARCMMSPPDRANLKFPCKVSFKEVEKGSVSNKNNRNEWNISSMSGASFSFFLFTSS